MMRGIVPTERRLLAEWLNLFLSLTFVVVVVWESFKFWSFHRDDSNFDTAFPELSLRSEERRKSWTHKSRRFKSVKEEWLNTKGKESINKKIMGTLLPPVNYFVWLITSSVLSTCPYASHCTYLVAQDEHKIPMIAITPRAIHNPFAWYVFIS